MTVNLLLNHVAMLVPSVRKAADFLCQFGFQIGPEETFESEGTREIYVEGDKSNSLLLLEPIGPGPYQRAMKKRGPGLHHLAISVLNLESYIESLSESGWLLHPMSLKTVQRSQTAYLARPGFSALIEVQQRDHLSQRPLFVERISFPMDPKLTRLLEPIGYHEIFQPSDECKLGFAGQTIAVRSLF